MSTAERHTLRGSPVVAAPGKVFLIGEYAVLEGAPAVVAAVNRLAVGQYIPGGEPASAFVAVAVEAALAGIGDRAEALPVGSVLVDSSAFSADGRKLGLGSSAAVTAATVAAVLELAGLSVAANRDLCFSLAQGAHRTTQGGQGSGADVAAAVHGGLVRFRRPPGGYPVVDRMKTPPDLRIVVFAEGKASSTMDHLAAMKAFAERRPDEHAALMRPLREHAELFVESLATASMRGMLSAARGYAEGLGELGTRSGVPIFTPHFEIAADLATNLGGVAKPSGAGGGDIGVALFGTAEAAEIFSSRLSHIGLRLLDVAIEPNGVHRRLPSSTL